ncbi:MAG: B12-binding domain-containing radical SAM protein [Thermodesulfobacteriota bacterium]
MRRKEILMVQLGGFKYEVEDSISIEAPLTPPLALGYLYSYAKGLPDISMTILEPWQIAEFTPKELVDKILSFSPSIAVFSCYIWNIDHTLEVIRTLKLNSPSTRVVVGGPEICNFKHMEGNDNIDIGIIGEGEEAFYRIISDSNFFSSGERLLTVRSGDERQIPNIHPPYASGVFNLSKYKHVYLETYRGCYQNCTYCFFNKDRTGLGFFSEEYLDREISFLSESGIRYVIIIDSIFNYPQWGESVCDIIAKHNGSRRIELSADIQAELVNREFCEAAERANFVEFQAGLQSYNVDSLKLVERKSSLDEFEAGILKLKEHNFRVNTDLIVGLPGDTISDVENGVEYLKGLGVDDVRVALLRILPGTKLWSDYEEMKIEFDRSHPYFITSTDKISSDEIKDFLLGANHRVF